MGLTLILFRHILLKLINLEAQLWDEIILCAVTLHGKVLVELLFPNLNEEI